MKGRLFQRIVLALIPVGLLTTASLALSIISQPVNIATPTVEESAEAAPPRFMTATGDHSKTLAAQADDNAAPKPDGLVVQAPENVAQAPVAIPDEPLPELVIDKSPLTRAMADLERALEQAKLSVTALDAQGQGRYIQETINWLAGFADPTFRAVTANANADTYKGVRPQLVEARVVREAAEVQWIAAVQQQMEARSKRLTEIAQAGDPSGTVTLPPTTVDLSATVGPTGVLGTRGVRPEEQAIELVSQAIRQATAAMRTTATVRQTGGAEGDAVAQGSEESLHMMEAVVRKLEAARKIIEIAINR